MNELYEKFINDIADLVIKKMTDSSSNMLNTIQYKVRAENIEGQIQASQIDGLEDMIEEQSHVTKSDIRDIAREEAEDVINNCTISTTINA